MLGMKKANYRFFNINDKKLLKELKKIIIEEAEEHEKVIEDHTDT